MVTYTANSHVYGKHTRLIILWIYIAILPVQFQDGLAHDSRLTMILSALIIRMHTYTGGTWPLVARACAPVCPSLAVPQCAPVWLYQYLPTTLHMILKL